MEEEIERDPNWAEVYALVEPGQLLGEDPATTFTVSTEVDGETIYQSTSVLDFDLARIPNAFASVMDLLINTIDREIYRKKNTP